jgi:iron complex transport system ATP-binding protein
VSQTALLRSQGLGWDALGRRILGSVDLEVRWGECLAVVGPNGAGKTTLLRLLTGLLAPSRGRLSWHDGDYSQLSRRDLARRIAYVPQSRPLRIPLSVEEMVLLGRYPFLSPLRLAPQQSDFAAVSRALRLAGVEDLRRRPLAELSGGERQAVYIAAALAQEADLMVLDEPTTHLDPSHQRDVANLLSRLNRQGGLSVVVATHDLNFASLLADRILALRGGVRPPKLGEVFGAPFSVIRAGERPMIVLEWGREEP